VFFPGRFARREDLRVVKVEGTGRAVEPGQQLGIRTRIDEEGPADGAFDEAETALLESWRMFGATAGRTVDNPETVLSSHDVFYISGVQPNVFFDVLVLSDIFDFHEGILSRGIKQPTLAGAFAG
jgi:hypothetical protein